jgi:hypothetical protein
MRVCVTLLAVALLVLAGGCGGGDGSSPAKAATAPGNYLSATALEVQLGNSFRHGLYRLAVMSQAEDDAKDLGQPLTTGSLQRTRCASAAPRPAHGAAWRWTCTVRWRSAAGRPHTTDYAVRVTPPGCFSAGASPRRGVRYDVTIRSFAADPLDALLSVRRGC